MDSAAFLDHAQRFPFAELPAYLGRGQFVRTAGRLSEAELAAWLRQRTTGPAAEL